MVISRSRKQGFIYIMTTRSNIVADLNGDGKKEVRVATNDAKIQASEDSVAVNLRHFDYYLVHLKPFSLDDPGGRRSSGGGSMLTWVELPSQPTHSIVTEDFSKDGLTDLILVSSNGVYGFVQARQSGALFFSTFVGCDHLKGKHRDKYKEPKL